MLFVLSVLLGSVNGWLISIAGASWAGAAGGGAELWCLEFLVHPASSHQPTNDLLGSLKATFWSQAAS